MIPSTLFEAKVAMFLLKETEHIPLSCPWSLKRGEIKPEGRLVVISYWWQLHDKQFVIRRENGNFIFLSGEAVESSSCVLYWDGNPFRLS